MFAQTRVMRLLPLASVLLAACSLHQPPEPGQSPQSPRWQQHQQAVGRITHYQIRGAFACISDKQKIYARFNWQQTAPDRYRLLLTNPLGSTGLQLDVQGSVVQLVDSKGQRYVSNNAEKLLSQLTGMSIPLNNLRQWIMGLPGEATDYTLDEQFRLKSARYHRDGQQWNLILNRYNNQQHPPLPSGLELTTGDQRIKLRMDSWTVES